MSQALLASSRAVLRTMIVARLRGALTLNQRKQLVVWLHRSALARRWSWLSFALLDDHARADPNGFHRFLWSNHLGYARTYDPAQRFGSAHVHASRTLLFQDIKASLRASAYDPDVAIRSVLEVGCSVGHVLRYVETDAFPSATVLVGFDIDHEAIERGCAELASLGSKIMLHVGDMSDMARDECRYDLVVCAGVLQYLRCADATRVVAALLERADKLVAITGLANRDMDNAELEASAVRPEDSSFIHNIDAMVEAGGGVVVSRRWQGASMLDGRSIYFVLAAPIADRSRERGCP